MVKLPRPTTEYSVGTQWTHTSHEPQIVIVLCNTPIDRQIIPSSARQSNPVENEGTICEGVISCGLDPGFGWHLPLRGTTRRRPHWLKLGSGGG